MSRLSTEPSGSPDVTILIPARNEEHDIVRALDGVLAQTYPHDRIEVLVVTGGSTDRTGHVAKQHLAAGGFASIVILDNADGSTPSNLNAGLSEARGAYLCRVDARSLIPPDYVARCVRLLAADDGLVVVGGAQVAVHRSDSATDVGIARALNNRWGMGLSKYRRGAPSGPADTVYLGAFRTDQLLAVGGWDQRFATNQDFELNRRMGRAGTVWFESGIDVGYLPRSSVQQLFTQYRRFGRWKVRYWRLTGDRPRPRQTILLVAPLVGLSALVAGVACRPRWTPGAAVVLAAGLVGLEARGTDAPRGSAGAHVAGVAAMVAVGVGWTLGVWESLLSREHRG